MMNTVGFSGYMGFPGVLMFAVWVALVVVPFWSLWGRTGHNPWISLLMVVPIVNVIMLYVLAFKQWPIDGNRVQ